jgi:peroxiredoxin Q/BCP
MARPERATARSGVTARRAPRKAARRIPWPLVPLLAGVAAIVVGIAAMNTLSKADQRSLPYDVGRPGPGDLAPDFTVTTAVGDTFRLADQRGKQVLLYFHEGLGCDPCWRQIDNIQADFSQFNALGIDQVVPISADLASAQSQRAQRGAITFPVVPDVGLAVSRAYDTLVYGMMNGMVPGHTFILVGADGKIRWRADYGGSPNYTMFVPDSDLLAQLRKVIGGA